MYRFSCWASLTRRHEVSPRASLVTREIAEHPSYRKKADADILPSPQQPISRPTTTLW